MNNLRTLTKIKYKSMQFIFFYRTNTFCDMYYLFYTQIIICIFGAQNKYTHQYKSFLLQYCL